MNRSITSKNSRLRTRLKRAGVSVAILLIVFQHARAQMPGLSADQQMARDILKELVEINTTLSSGNTTLAANAMAKRLLDAGFARKDVQVIGPEPRNQNLIVRFHGSGSKRPMLFLAHLDVVEANREDWSMDPFKLTEKDGYFYGRGTLDIKNGAAILIADFIRMKREGFVPERDLVVALTAGEESSLGYNGVEWLIKNHRALIDAECCINMDAGAPQIKGGKRISRTVQASEKGFLDLTLEVKSAGGHSSRPSKDNAIYRLSAGLLKLAGYDFPAQLNEVTRRYLNEMSALEKGQIAVDMKTVANDPNDTAAIRRLSESLFYNAMMRTTCVATMLQAGHADNALPQSAKAIVNCRVLPGVSQDEVQKTIIRLVADSQIVVTVTSSLKKNPASALSPAVMKIVEKVTGDLWPGIPVIPVMSPGATDGIYLRGAGIPTYGIAGVFSDVDDNRAHGKDERIGVNEFYDGLQYEYTLIKALSSMP